METSGKNGPEPARGRERRQNAEDRGLSVLDGKIPLPALPIADETAEREQSKKVEMDLATRDDHRHRLAAQARAGFSLDARKEGIGPLRRALDDPQLTKEIPMNIPPEHLSAIRNLGYTDTEASFLYLVATHSGYFTQRHYLTFGSQTKGRLVHQLTTRVLNRRHARATSYANNTHVYNLYSRRIYGAIDKDNLRNRRHQSIDRIHTRLMILSFVIAHRHHHYLETEAAKTDHFTRQAGLPLAVLPGRIYYGIKSAANTPRYFVDRFPIFLPASGNPEGLPPVVTFTYCDTPGTSLAAYLAHLRQYENLLRQLPDFNFIFSSAEPSKFDRARALFTQIFGPKGQPNTRRLLHYFDLRKLWDTQHTADLTRADRDFLRQAMHEFQAPKYEAAYRKWAAEGLSRDEITDLISNSHSPKGGCFYTYVQPEAFNIFSTAASRHSGTREQDRSSGRFHLSGSTPCEP